jgi:hypothetical protein
MRLQLVGTLWAGDIQVPGPPIFCLEQLVGDAPFGGIFDKILCWRQGKWASSVEEMLMEVV